MAKSKYKVGDRVQLKSGGPEMTVTAAPGPYDDYRTKWFAGAKLAFGDFPEDALMPYADPEDVKLGE